MFLLQAFRTLCCCLSFTDGGIEGPIGFKLSRKAVKAVLNGAKLAAHIDLKPAVEAQQLERRIDELWKEISDDKRSYVVIRGKRTLRPYKPVEKGTDSSICCFKSSS